MATTRARPKVYNQPTHDTSGRKGARVVAGGRSPTPRPPAPAGQRATQHDLAAESLAASNENGRDYPYTPATWAVDNDGPLY